MLLDQLHATAPPWAEENPGGLVHHQHYGRRAGHLVPYTASLATHTTSDSGPGRSKAPWTARSTKAQAPQAKPTVL